jgi:L-cysteine/cystine lyase
MNWAEERARFPVLERFAYLNAGTFGPLARATIDAMSQLRAWEADHGRGGRAYFDEMLARRERVRTLFAEHLHVRVANIALTESTSQGVQVVVAGLELGPEDHVVTTDAEHFGLTGPLLASGARLQIAKVRGARADDVFDLISAAITPRTRLIATSAVSWLDGTIFPWRELQKASGVPVLIDGAQSVGALEVDATAADFYTVSAQKWLCGPDATGALYVREPNGLRPRLVAYPSVETYDIGAGTWEPKAGAARFDTGFAPASSLAGLEAALTGLPAGRFERARELAERCRTLLADAGHEVVTETGQSTLVTFVAQGGFVAQRDAPAASAALYDRGVVVRDLPSSGFLRASVGWWNDESDLERLVEALEK